jgi:phytoene/squalene synthetase
MGEGEFDDVVDEMDSDPDTRNWRYWQDDLATVNDEPYADEHSREVAVADVFSRAGILVEFVG